VETNKRSKHFPQSTNAMQIHTDTLKINEMFVVLWGKWTNSTAWSPASHWHNVDKPQSHIMSGTERNLI